jgi:hypothetical protein
MTRMNESRRRASRRAGGAWWASASGEGCGGSPTNFTRARRCARARRGSGAVVAFIVPMVERAGRGDLADIPRGECGIFSKSLG